jgi:sialate O-acetylesterase
MVRYLPLIPFLLSNCFSQDLKIVSGAVDNQVLQRSADGSVSIQLTGTSPSDGKNVEVRVTKKGSVVKGLHWQSIGKVDGGKWSGSVVPVPAGGPYNVELRVAGKKTADATIKDILVGDLWVLAGQSNMEGVGDLVDVEPPNALVHSFDQTDKWDIAKEPLHRLVDATDRVHWRMNAQKTPEKMEGADLEKFIANRKKGAGLGLPFAVEMVRRTGVPIGLLPCAHGGTSMDQWSPEQKEKGGDSLYGATIRRVKLVGGKVTGILWYQGESDASVKAAPEFLGKFERLVAAFRADFGQPELPFYSVQIGRHVNYTGQNEWNSVQNDQIKSETTIPHSGMVVSVDSVLDDGIHVSTQDQKKIGRRLADLATHAHKNGPRFASLKREGAMVRVSFTGVNGKLRADGRISGFSIHSPKGDMLPLIFKVKVDPKDPSSVLLSIGGAIPPGAVLRYGAGRDPYCNLDDEKGMGVPVFGPVEIQ